MNQQPKKELHAKKLKWQEKKNQNKICKSICELKTTINNKN